MDYFIGDYHNGDSGCFVYDDRCKRFKNLEEMYDVIVENSNRVVSDDDNLYILGDIGDIGILSELKGNLIIVAGNHDDVEAIRKQYPHIEVNTHPIMVGNLWLSHEPIGYMPVQCPYLNIHAHTHYMRYLGPGTTWDSGNRYFCCSVDQPYMDYSPVSLEQIGYIIGYKKNSYMRIRPKSERQKGYIQ